MCVILCKVSNFAQNMEEHPQPLFEERRDHSLPSSPLPSLRRGWGWSFVRLAETDSTNEEVKRRGAVAGLCVIADYQSSGRGQQNASWESERDKNLLFSVALRPQEVAVSRQFRLSQAMAVAVCDGLSDYAEDIRIKWPNDIYWKERKLSGTIIETSWHGNMVERAVIGVGINVNQRVFRSNAPNPVSLCMITGCELDCEEILHKVLTNFSDNLMLLAEDEAELACRYNDRLIWRNGLHRYRDAGGTFEAEFVDIRADGRLLLRDTNEQIREYYFKEVKHVFPSLTCN